MDDIMPKNLTLLEKWSCGLPTDHSNLSKSVIKSMGFKLKLGLSFGYLGEFSVPSWRSNVKLWVFFLSILLKNGENICFAEDAWI